MAIRDKLLKTQLTSQENRHQTDIHETDRPYKRWTPGLRTLLRLRYLGIKKNVLRENQQSLQYGVSTEEVQKKVLTKIQSVSSSERTGVWPAVLKPVFIAPLLLILLAAASYLTWRSHQSALDQALFKRDIPAYSDAVYRLKAATHSDNASTQALEDEVQQIKQKILAHFSSNTKITDKLETVLERVTDKDLAPQELFSLTKLLNDELFASRIPYYISPTAETADCSHLPLTAFLPRLFGGAQGSGELCVIYALLSFHVEEFRYYQAQSHNHLAFFTRRLDGLDIHDNVLGKVHLGDNTAQILLSNIDASSKSSTTAVYEGQLQSKLMPQGMPDVYGLESIARRLQTRLLEHYTNELRESWQWNLKRVWNQLRNREENLLPEATKKLQRRVADITAFHEVQHLIDQFNDLQEPPWLEQSLQSVATSVPMTDQFRSHVLWELSAFFTHMSNADELKGVLLNEFTAITLNPMLQDQPHYYSIRILLPVLQAMHKNELGSTPPDAALTLADVARNYKYLSTHVDELDELARDAYQILFKQQLPEITQINNKLRTSNL